MVEINKNNLTTYISGALIFIFGTLGISQSVANGYVQLLAPILSLIIAYVFTYLTEKYPSSLVTPVSVVDDAADEETESNSDAI